MFGKGPFIKVVLKWVHGGPQYGPGRYVVKIQSAKNFKMPARKVLPKNIQGAKTKLLCYSSR